MREAEQQRARHLGQLGEEHVQSRLRQEDLASRVDVLPAHCRRSIAAESRGEAGENLRVAARPQILLRSRGRRGRRLRLWLLERGGDRCAEVLVVVLVSVHLAIAFFAATR